MYMHLRSSPTYRSGGGKFRTRCRLGIFRTLWTGLREGTRLIRRHTVRAGAERQADAGQGHPAPNRHLALPEQGRYLRLVVNGFYNYYAVPTNFRALNAFYYHVLCSLATLPPATQRATQADVAEDDADRGTLAAQPEVAAPLSRLAVRRHDPRWEPGALAAHAGICAGAASNRRPYRGPMWFATPSSQRTCTVYSRHDYGVGARDQFSFRGSMAGLCAPLPTLRRRPHGRRRTG